MLYLTFPLAALIEILVPVALAIGLTRRFGRSYWLLAGVGLLTFIGSQVVHIPLNLGLSQLGLLTNAPALMLRTALVGGLSAGLCEETARAIGYWSLKQRARTWPSALALGIGHGGLESMLVGVLVLLTFVNMVIIRHLGAANLGLPEEQVTLVEQQLAAYWGYAWHVPFVGAVERLIALALHLSLSVLVLQAFTRRNGLYYLAAVIWHAVIDAGAVILLARQWDFWSIEGVLALSLPISLGIIVAFRHSRYDVAAQPVAAPSPLPPVELKPRDETDTLQEQIERSRFET